MEGETRPFVKRTLLFLFFLALTLSIPFGAKKCTQGFRLAKLQLDFPSEPRWDFELDPNVKSILDQPYHFLGKGAQSYVFESKDGKYVVKLFRFDRKKDPQKIACVFEACKLAYENLREETGLIYIHLNPTPEMLPLFEATDPLGRSIKIPLDPLRFAVQKKAESFEKIFLEAKGDPIAMQKRIDQLRLLLQTRVAKGIWNKDPNLSRNFGFLEDRAIEFDFGNYRQNPSLDQKKEITRFSKKLDHWLKKNIP